MWHRFQTGALLLGLLATGLAGAISAEEANPNKGQADFDAAIEAKLTATTLSDLGEVIRLFESALEKGLDEANAKDAKLLLASTRIRRGMVIAGTIFRSIPLDANWPTFRRMALEDLEKGLELEPGQPQPLFLVARLNLLLPGGDMKRGKAALDEAIDKGADDPPTRARALVLRAELADEPEKKLADLDEAVKAAPGDAAVLRARGAAYSEQGKHAEALADFEEAQKFAPDDLGLVEARAMELVDLQRYDEGLKLLAELREKVPDAAAPWFQQGRVRALQGDFQAALNDLNEAATREPGNIGVLLLRATVFQELKQPEKALADVEQALKLKPDLPVAMRIRASILAGSGQFGAAIEELEKLGRADPKDVQIGLQLALLYSAEKRFGKAIAKFTEVIAADPTNQSAWQGRADALLSVGRQAEAVADYEQCLKLDPKDSSVLNNLAWVLCTSPDDKLRDGKRAIELATEACKLTEYKQAHILSTLGAAYAETGDFKTAMEWSEKAIEAGEPEQKETLAKELESYKAGKPMRELQQEPEEPNEPEKPTEPGSLKN